MDVQRVMKYGYEVWANTPMDDLRRSECLCLNCARFKPGDDDHCPIAAAGYQLCLEYHIAYMMTRCPKFEAESEE